MNDTPHPLARLALELVTPTGALTEAGRERLVVALRANADRDAALALLEVAYFLATQGSRAAADAIGAVVAAEASDALRAIANAQDAATETKAREAQRLIGGAQRSQIVEGAPKGNVARAGPGAQFALQRAADKDKH